MLSRLGANLQIFLWALVLAIAVWVAAVTAADPDEVRVYPSPIKLQIVGQDPGFVIGGSLPQEVQVSFRAPRSVGDQLISQPDGIRAILDLSGLGAGDHTLNLQIQTNLRPVRIITVNPSSVTFKLEPLITRSVPVELNLSGQLPIGYQAGTAIVDPKEVVISGPKSLVSSVVKVSTQTSLNGTRGSLDLMLPIEAFDQKNQSILGLTFHPDTAHVILPISQQGGFRDLAVKVVVRGQVASGYRLENISVFPPVVTVYSSDLALVNALPGVVETQPLDLQGVNGNLSTQLSVNVPAGVSVVGQQTVLIQAGVSPIQSSFTLSGEQVEATGLPAGLDIKISPATVDVILSGPLPLLDTLTRQDVHVVVDLTGLGVGTYQLSPKVTILVSNVTMESLLPANVEVTLAPAATPTVKP
jgi:YbbR domain-containing protein